MLGKFSKKEREFVEEAREHVRAAVDVLKEMVNRSEFIVQTAADLEERIQHIRALYDQAVEVSLTATSFFTTFAEDQQSQYDEKSERWQEGDRAQQVSSWIDALESLGGQEFPLFELVEVEVLSRPDGSDEDEGDSGLPKMFPAIVTLEYAIDTGDLDYFVEELEGLADSADEL